MTGRALVAAACALLLAACAPDVPLAEARAAAEDLAQRQIIQVVGQDATVQSVEPDLDGCSISGRQASSTVVLEPQGDADLLALLVAAWEVQGPVLRSSDRAVRQELDDGGLLRAIEADGLVRASATTGPCYGLGEIEEQGG